MEMGMYELVGVIPVLLVSLMWVVFLPFIIFYVIEHVRGRRAGRRDPHLGTKVMLTCLTTVAFQLVLAGGAVLLGTAIEGGYAARYGVKTGAALMVAGTLAGLLPFISYLVRFSADNEGVRMGRKAVGVNALLCGIMMMVSITMLLMAAFHEARAGIPAGFAMMYVPAAAACILLTAASSSNEPDPEPVSEATTEG